MPTFSLSSRARLLTCHPDLQRLFNKVIERRDCTIISGQRGEAEQNELFRKGMSKVKHPNSKHNGKPSMAVDVMAYFDCEPHIRWVDVESQYNFIGYVQGIADELGIRIRSGGDWDMDNDFDDQSFIDVAHFELISGD